MTINKNSFANKVFRQIQTIYEPHQTFSIDDIKKTTCKARRLTINCPIANIHIKSSDSNEISANLHGKCKFIGFFPFLVLTINTSEIKIEVKSSELKSYNNLRLDIVIPKILYDHISIKSIHGNISIDNSIKVKNTNLETKHGNIAITCKSCNLSATSTSGNITLKLYADSEANLKLSSHSGNINLSLYNVKTLHLFKKTKNGKSKNRFHKARKGYVIAASVSTANGKIHIK